MHENDGFHTETPIPLVIAAELQDHLMTASCDLERLQRLLNDASDSLSSHFNAASELVHAINGSSDALNEMKMYLGQAVVALQFHDMATQLIAHTNHRLHVCASQLARDALGDDEDGMTIVDPPPLRPNPVTQDEMDAGSIELF